MESQNSAMAQKHNDNEASLFSGAKNSFGQR